MLFFLLVLVQLVQLVLMLFVLVLVFSTSQFICRFTWTCTAHYSNVTNASRLESGLVRACLAHLPCPAMWPAALLDRDDASLTAP